MTTTQVVIKCEHVVYAKDSVYDTIGALRAVEQHESLKTADRIIVTAARDVTPDDMRLLFITMVIYPGKITTLDLRQCVLSFGICVDLVHLLSTNTVLREVYVNVDPSETAAIRAIVKAVCGSSLQKKFKFTNARPLQYAKIFDLAFRQCDALFGTALNVRKLILSCHPKEKKTLSAKLFAPN